VEKLRFAESRLQQTSRLPLTCDNKVPFVQSHDAADVVDQVRDVEQHVARAAPLLQLTVHLPHDKHGSSTEESRIDASRPS
jgi:hypothetical protein